MFKTTLIIVMAALCLNFNTKAQQQITLSGKITDQQNRPMPGVSLKIKDSRAATTTGINGQFNIATSIHSGILQISFLGYQPVEVPFAGTSTNISVQLKEDQNNLNEVQVIGYGQTTKRLNAGSVATLSAKQIEQQPVTNVLSALSGRMPGVFVQTTNGLPGGAINIQIRGKGSITAGTAPLYIIDGVPFESALQVPSSLIAQGSLSGAVNPLNSLNPADIESISVLKDADATAIYGSRGSNGVILITTKKPGAVNRAGINFSQGINKAANQPKLLNLQQYLTLRKEAFANDNLTPNTTNAPDLLSWSQTQATNWPEYLLGNTASTTDAQASLQGGNANTSFSTSANFHTENTIVSKQSRYLRGGLHSSLNHKSAGQKFSLQISSALVLDQNAGPNVQNINSSYLLVPNYPLFNADGTYNWYSNNPLAEMTGHTSTKTDNLVTNFTLAYALTKQINFKVSAGYNKMNINQLQLAPASSLSPGLINYTQFGKNSNQTYLVEPQLTFNKQFKNSKIEVLLGGTYQNRQAEEQFIKASNFSNEELMENLASATTLDFRTNNFTRYRYVSAFARINYQLNSNYILNLTARRDGSSRFGPGNRFGNFGSAGAAWVFSEENWLKTKLPVLSYGKLRASYGSVGNDQIPDYQYLSAYTSSGFVYQGLTTLRPLRIYNADFHWETTRKLDVAIELGLFKNRLMLNANYFRNQSHDQLVQYALPRLTGFASYQANLPAVVQNTGWELELSSTNIRKNNFSWQTTFNFTLPKNKLVSFQNFESSSYSQTLQLGYDISRIYGIRMLGVNPETGLASYADRNGNASTAPYSFHTIGKQSPDLYGGLGNTLSYKSISLDVFFQFSKQHALGALRTSPGLLVNNPAHYEKRWQQKGDITSVPKASTLSDFYYTLSSANYFDSSYIRLKTVAISWKLPQTVAGKIKASSINVFARAQNLFTIWNDDVPLSDPESGALTSSQRSIAPVSSVVAGISLNL